ncbi:MAG: endolytic transglycosylase MltG [Ruminococcus sp.]|nr:endolytic transglycosylase MltG [Ruminococcus sp.]
MDEKDFSFGDLNKEDPSGEQSSRQEPDFEDDFSFGSSSKQPRPEAEEPAAPEPEPDYPEETDDPGEPEQEDEQAQYSNTFLEFTAGFGDDDTTEGSSEEEEVPEEGTPGDVQPEAEEYPEDYSDDEPEELSDEAPEDEAGEPVIAEDVEAQDDYDDEPDISLHATATNGVMDFRERRNSPPKRTTKKKKKKKSRVNNSIFGALILVTIILTVSLVVAITGIKIGMEYLGVGKSEDDITFNIPENASSDDICEILIANNIIENRTLFKIAMKLQHSPTLYPGDVTLHPSMGYSAVIEELSKQRDIRKTVSVTFKEGITLLEAANLLEENKVCTAQDFLFEFNKSQGFSFEKQIDETADTFYKMEGFFFPDTYEFYVDDTGYNVTRTIKTNFASKVNDTMLKTIESKKMTLSEVITLASIVQWEANSAEDMPKVASVFLNRLADPDTFPKLQSDATGNYMTKVINVVGDTASKDHYADLYDTYVCTGLPAGPVCNPGLDAINAVLNPESTKYYYFCNNLKTGKSYFAETLEEHEKNLVKAGLKKK